MKSRLPAAAVALVLLGGALAAPAAQADPSTTIVISKIMTRGPAGGNDEFIELKNKSTRSGRDRRLAAVGHERERLVAERARARSRPGTELAAGAVYRLTNSQGGADRRQPDLLDRHLRRRRPAAALERRRDVGGRRRRQRGADRRRDPVPRGHWPERRARVPDRQRQQRLHPQGQWHPGHRRQRRGLRARGRPAPPPSCPKDAGGFTKITDIQTLGSAANPLCVGPTDIKIRGIVTGVDDLYGSNFDNIFPLRRRPLGPAGHA